MAKKNEKKPMSYRALAKALGRSPSHICRVMRGERVSRRLAAQLRRCGVKIVRTTGSK